MGAILQPLRDRVRPPVRVLLVGINPGIRSAETGHHFAGYSNRFWKLLYESRLVPEAIGYADDVRLPEFGFGITNLIPRPTPGIDTLGADEYIAGERALRRKVRRWQPAVVAFVGVTLFRTVFGRRGTDRVALGLQAEMFEGARVFVLPNPSGRNANYSYREMLRAFRALRTFLHLRRGPTPAASLR
jgi:double-stranded uracil-DNA glycosylase